MNTDNSETYTNLLFVCCVVLMVFFLGFVVRGTESNQRRWEFYAERACKPGMFLSSVKTNRNNNTAICIGGQQETWIVKVY